MWPGGTSLVGRLIGQARFGGSGGGALVGASTGSAVAACQDVDARAVRKIDQQQSYDAIVRQRIAIPSR